MYQVHDFQFNTEREARRKAAELLGGLSLGMCEMGEDDGEPGETLCYNAEKAFSAAFATKKGLPVVKIVKVN
jgi:hypothetical protein